MSNQIVQPTNQRHLHLEPSVCQRARLSKDARFDGQFFTAVITTGIFCRPICPAKPPLEENVRYLSSAIEALQQGFAPCKRCLPELAPSSQSLVNAPEQELSLADVLCQHHGNVKQSASTAKLSERQFRRSFSSQYAMPPNKYWQQFRLITALKLLRSSNLTVTEVCFIAGFNSVRRFNEAIKQAYQQVPKKLQQQSKPRDKEQTIKVELYYRPPLDWPLMLSFFQQRLIPELEQVTDDYYARVFQMQGATGWFKLSSITDKHALQLEVATNDYALLPIIISKVRTMFDLDANLNQIQQVLSQEPLLKQTITAYPGLRLPGSWDIFEFSIRAILGQQISVKAATTIASRIAKRYGESAPSNPFGLSQLFPSIKCLIDADFTELGLTQSRIATLKTWCQFYQRSADLLNSQTPLSALETELTKLKGIGPWTINYIAMRGLSYPDAFPSADLGIIKALEQTQDNQETNDKKLTNKAILAKAEQWRPWRSYAAIYLWQSLVLKR